ncbi:hypothetical protein ACKWTF_014272 [Chironomus riparius]
MKIIFAFVLIAVVTDVHGGGDSNCSSSIALYQSLSLQLRSGFSNIIKSPNGADPYLMFKNIVKSIATTSPGNLSPADIATIQVINDAEDAALTCIFPYVIIR